MCHYISVVASERPPDLKSEANGRPATIAFAPRDLPALQPHLRAEERVYWAGVHCDCGTALGSLRRDEKRRSSSRDRIEEKAMKLRRGGWSETKIARWKEEKASRPSLQKAAALDQRELQEWTALLHSVVTGRRTAGLFLALESGRNDEQIPVRDESVAIATVTPQWLAAIEENVLYRFRNA